MVAIECRELIDAGKYETTQVTCEVMPHAGEHVIVGDETYVIDRVVHEVTQVNADTWKHTNTFIVWSRLGRVW